MVIPQWLSIAWLRWQLVCGFGLRVFAYRQSSQVDGEASAAQRNNLETNCALKGG
jgi:hypothetical protein